MAWSGLVDARQSRVASFFLEHPEELECGSDVTSKVQTSRIKSPPSSVGKHWLGSFARSAMCVLVQAPWRYAE
jgi:hypothetical protein